MLINTEKKRITAAWPAELDGSVRRLSAVDADAVSFGGEGIFDPGAAQYAAALAMSAASEEMLRENLTALGYQRIVFLGFEGDDESKIGTAMGIREECDGAVIAVILRPTVGREWYSNFDVGYGGEHLGFLKAAEYAEQKLTDYLFVRRLKTPPRFFVTGYSRGGAVANLLSKRLCDRWGLDAVRCYTFASPNTCVTVRAARYQTIFNLVRDEDFFTRVPLSGWGYTKYGRTLSLSDRGDIRGRFRELTGREYGGFLSDREVEGFLCGAMRLAPNVHAYCERHYPVGDRRMSLRGYMMTLARLLADEADESAGDTMLDAMTSNFAGLSDFLMSGMDLAAFLSPAQGIPRCSASDSHSPAAYSAALELFLAK